MRIRDRRAGLRPDDVGLPTAPPRPDPGLQREEVAALVGVGVRWYTCLEEGQDVHPSAEILDRVAHVLRLDPGDRLDLLALAEPGRGPEPGVPTGDREASALPKELQDLLDELEPLPACIVDGRFDVTQCNRTFGRAVIGLDGATKPGRRATGLNLIHPAWRAAIVKAEQPEPRSVQELRSELACLESDYKWTQLVERLCASSPDFEAVWREHSSDLPKRQVVTVDSERAGTLRLENLAFRLDDAADTTLVVYRPVDEPTRRRLRGVSGVSGASGAARGLHPTARIARQRQR